MTAWSARYFLESIYTSATCLISYLHGLPGGLHTTILSQNIVGLVRNSHEIEINAIVAALTGVTSKMTSPSLIRSLNIAVVRNQSQVFEVSPTHDRAFVHIKW
jgi:hypothetical protein